MRNWLKIGATLAAMAVNGQATALPKGFKAKADAIVQAAFKENGAGVSIAIGEKGKIVYLAQRGYANIAAKRPINANTGFRLGSITKQFTAAVVLQLAAEEALDLNDPLSKFLPDYPNGDAITIRELLNHTSGVQRYTAIPGWIGDTANTDKVYTTEQLIAVFKDKPAESAPGTAYQYNNSGYILLAGVIEAVTKHPWYEAVQARIATPLMLPTLGYGPRPLERRAMATGYADGRAATPVLAQKIDKSAASGAGSLVASATDVTRWGQALHHDQVVHAPYYEPMTTSSMLPNGTKVSYGYGLMPGTVGALKTIWHNGRIFGFWSDSIYVPTYDVFVTVLTNSDNPQTSPEALATKLAALATTYPLDDKFPPKHR